MKTVVTSSDKGTLNSVQSWLIWLCPALFYLYQFVLRVSPNVMVPDLMTSFASDAATVGMLASFYYYAYSPLQLPVGVLLDRFGPRRVLAVATLLCVAGGVIFATATYLPMAQLGRFLIGAGSACAFAGTLKAASLWFGPERISLVTGLTVTLGTSGAISAGAPLVLAINAFGWRPAMLIISGLGLLLTVLIMVLVKDKGPNSQPGTDYSWQQVGRGLKTLVRSRPIWILAFYGSCMYVPLLAFADVWGTSYLMRLFSIDSAKASGMSSVIYIGMAIGGTLWAIFSDWVGSRKLPMVLSALGTGIIFWIVVYSPFLSIGGMTALLFLAGFFCSGHYMSFVSACELTPKEINATAVAFVNMITMAGGIVFQPLVGWILDLNWQGTFYEGTRSYSLENYRLAITAIPLSLTLGTILAFLLKDSGARKKPA